MEERISGGGKRDGEREREREREKETEWAADRSQISHRESTGHSIAVWDGVIPVCPCECVVCVFQSVFFFFFYWIDWVLVTGTALDLVLGGLGERVEKPDARM